MSGPSVDRPLAGGRWRDNAEAYEQQRVEAYRNGLDLIRRGEFESACQAFLAAEGARHLRDKTQQLTLDVETMKRATRRRHL